MAVELSDALRVLANTVTRSTESYTEAISELHKTYSEGARSKREKLQMEKKAEIDAVKKTADAFDSVYKAAIKWKAEEKMLYGATSEAAAELGETIKQLVDSGQITSIKLMDAINNINSSTQTQVQNVDDLAEAVAEEAAMRASQLKSMDKERQSTNKLSRSFDTLKDHAKSLGSKFFSLEGGIANISVGFVRTFDELEFSLKHQTEMFTMLSGAGQTWASDMALAPLEMQQMVAENKRLIHAAAVDYTDASGAITSAVKTMNRQTTHGSTMLEQAYELTGNFKDASALMMGTMNILQSVGIKKPFDVLGAETEKLMSDFQGLQRVTGQSAEAIQSQVAQYFQSAEAREELLKMDKTQRKNRVLEVVESMKYQVMLGKSTEAALEAQKALSSIAGMDTKTRMKEGAIMQAVASSLGMKEGARMRELFMKPTRSKDEERELRGYMDTMAQKQKGRQGQGGNIAMVAEATFGKLSSETQSIINAQNTELDKGYKLSEDQYKLLSENQPALGMIEKILLKTKEFWDQNIRGLLLDPATQILGGIAGVMKEMAIAVFGIWATSKLGIGTFKMLGAGFKSLKDVLPKLIPTFANGFKSLGTKMSSMIGAGTSLLGKIATKGIPLLGAGMFGWEFGTFLGDAWEKNAPDSRAAFGDALGSIVDNTLAFFGNEAAKSRLDILDKFDSIEDEKNKTEIENAQKMQELINALKEAVVDGNIQQQKLLKDQIKSINEQTQVQKETSEKAIEKQEFNNKVNNLRTVYVPM